MADLYEEEIIELIESISTNVSILKREEFSRLCFLIGNLQGQLKYFQIEEKE
jgi:hypothetical protein